jgi:hypothetical protein
MTYYLANGQHSESYLRVFFTAFTIFKKLGSNMELITSADVCWEMRWVWEKQFKRYL